MKGLNEDWLEVDEHENERVYTVRQDKWGPLKISTAILSGELVLIAFAAMGVASGSVGMVFVFGLFALIFAIPCFTAFVAGLVTSLAWAPVSKFRISPTEIVIQSAVETDRPVVLPRKEISHLYIGAGGRARSAQGVGVYSAGPVAAGTQMIGAAYRDMILQRNFGLWANYRGKDVYLAKHLSESRADYLFNDVNTILRFD